MRVVRTSFNEESGQATASDLFYEEQEWQAIWRKPSTGF